MGKHLFTLAAVIALAVAATATYLYAEAPPRFPASFTVGGTTHNFTAVAYTTAQQKKGLMNSTVTNGTFMLFAFQRPYRWGFWMKDTYAPLDMIWVYGNESGGKVVYVQHDALPCIGYDPGQSNCTVYTPYQIANYVIEAQAGFAQKSGSRTAHMSRSAIAPEAVSART